MNRPHAHPLLSNIVDLDGILPSPANSAPHGLPDPLIPSRYRAPHKRRGVLWLYMQQQTCQEGENVDAFLNAVARLYDTHVR